MGGTTNPSVQKTSCCWAPYTSTNAKCIVELLRCCATALPGCDAKTLLYMSRHAGLRKDCPSKNNQHECRVILVDGVHRHWHTKQLLYSAPTHSSVQKISCCWAPYTSTYAKCIVELLRCCAAALPGCDAKTLLYMSRHTDLRKDCP